MVRDEPDELPCVVAEPTDLPLASRKVVCPPPPALTRVVAVPMTRPEASRITACSVSPACFWRSMVWMIRPEECRTTSRQVWAGDVVTRVNANRTGNRNAFIGAYDRIVRQIIRFILHLQPGCIRHTSIHKAKGLDSKAVILIGMPPQLKLVTAYDHFSWFMAASRARQLLAVVEIGAFCSERTST